MANQSKVRTAEDYDRLRLALIPVDEAMWQSEQRWGVGRLERLISSPTLASYRRGWDAWRAALESGDADAVESIAPKMVAAIRFMEREAEAAGAQPLAVDVWEAPMGDGVVLVVARTMAEASHLIRANHGEAASYETTLPPDLAVTIRNTHEGRALVVVTLAEIARLMRAQETGLFGTKWEGTPAETGRQLDEMAAHDHVRSGYPLDKALPTTPTGQPAPLDF